MKPQKQSEKNKKTEDLRKIFDVFKIELCNQNSTLPAVQMLKKKKPQIFIDSHTYYNFMQNAET